MRRPSLALPSCPSNQERAFPRQIKQKATTSDSIGIDYEAPEPPCSTPSQLPGPAASHLALALCKIMSEKGKEREPPARQGLLWSDVYEHLGLAGQTRYVGQTSRLEVIVLQLTWLLLLSSSQPSGHLQDKRRRLLHLLAVFFSSPARLPSTSAPVLPHRQCRPTSERSQDLLHPSAGVPDTAPPRNTPLLRAGLELLSRLLPPRSVAIESRFMLDLDVEPARR